MSSASGGDRPRGSDAAPGGGPRIGPAHAARARPIPGERLDRSVRRSVLPGGTAVVSQRMESVRSVAVGIWFRQGAAHERPEERGISHLLEHMAFKGTGSRTARQIALDIESFGGSLDAFTTHEHTCFQARVPEAHLAEALDVLTDVSFRPTLRAADLELERNVVLDEIARVEDAPEELVFERHAALLYGPHPYGWPILGTGGTVASIGAPALVALHAEAFRPGNAVITAAGRLDHERLVRLLLPRLPAAPGAPAREIAPAGAAAPGRVAEERPGGRQTHIVAGARGVRWSDPLRYGLTVVGAALGEGMSSRLFQRIREEKGLAYNVYSFHAFYGAGGHVGAYVGTQPEAAGRAAEALLEELERVASEGLSARELEATRRQLRGQLHLAVESTSFHMERLALLELYGEAYRSVDEVAERIEAVTEEDAARAARFFHPDRMIVLELTPA